MRIDDYAQRRAQLIDGLVRVATRDGLHAVTTRTVAAEAARRCAWCSTPPSPRRVVALLAEAAPADETGRTFHILWNRARCWR